VALVAVDTTPLISFRAFLALTQAEQSESGGVGNRLAARTDVMSGVVQ